MARMLIKVEKDDVNTSKLGENIIIETKDNIDLILTPEAMEELINDYDHIISNEKENEYVMKPKEFEEEQKYWESLRRGDVIYDVQYRFFDVDYHKAIIKEINIDERYIIAYDVSSNVYPDNEIKLTSFITQEEFDRL